MTRKLPLIVGLTGQSGAGKTTACDFLKENGFGIVNCDLVAREVAEKNSPCLSELVSHFSNDILNEDLSLNRKQLGKIVFADKDKLSLLNKITHPYIINRVNEKINELYLQGFNIIIVDAPTLFESNADKLCDFILSIVTDEEKSIERIISRDNISTKDAKNRINSQLSKQFFIDNSDYIVINNLDIKDFYNQLNNVVLNLKEKISDNKG